MPLNLDERLAADTIEIAQWPLCEVRLMNNEYFPWIILVPQIENITELFELTAQEQAMLMREITHASQLLKAHMQADKINVATLGNMVKQLHIHIIARFHDDIAWPRSALGHEVKSYEPDKLDALMHQLIMLFANPPL